MYKNMGSYDNFVDKLSNGEIKNPFSETNKNELINKMLHCQSDEEYIGLVNSFVKSIHNDHTMLISPNFQKPNQYPLVVRYFDGKYVVGLSNNPEIKHQEIKSINGVPIYEYVKQLDGFTYDDKLGKPYKQEFTIEDLGKPLEIGLTDQTVFFDKALNDKELIGELSNQIDISQLQSNIKCELKNGVAYLRISKLASNHLEEAKALAQQFAEEVNNKGITDMVIDIRGNIGGTDEYINDVLGVFADKEYTSSPTFKFNCGDITEEELNKQNKLFKADELEARMFNNPVISDENVSEYKIEGNSTITNRVLLTDGATFSSADVIAKFCQNSGFAKIAGRATKGDGSGITPISFTTDILNEYGYFCRVPSSSAKDLESDYFTKPDIPLEEREPITSYEYGGEHDTVLEDVINEMQRQKMASFTGELQNMSVQELNAIKEGNMLDTSQTEVNKGKSL